MTDFKNMNSLAILDRLAVVLKGTTAHDTGQGVAKALRDALEEIPVEPERMLALMYVSDLTATALVVANHKSPCDMCQRTSSEMLATVVRRASALYFREKTDGPEDEI